MSVYFHFFPILPSESLPYELSVVYGGRLGEEWGTGSDREADKIIER